MSLSSHEQVIGNLPVDHQEKVRSIADALTGDEQKIFLQQVDVLGEKLKQETQEREEALQAIQTLIIQTEHALHGLEHDENNQKEQVEHVEDMQQAESILSTL
jgi:uncharacterized protein YgfB (UPF0149 family)